jgi:hypothetical protein
MADIEVHASVVWIENEGADRAVGFATSDDPEDGYVLFQHESGTGPETLYVEVSDEIFGASDAVERVTFAPGVIHLTLKPDSAVRFGMVTSVDILLSDDLENGAAAEAALRALLPAALVA